MKKPKEPEKRESFWKKSKKEDNKKKPAKRGKKKRQPKPSFPSKKRSKNK